MFAISFDMNISDLKIHYGIPYNRAYFEIKVLMKKHRFEWIQGSVYLTQSDDLGDVFKAIMALSKINWFKQSVRDIRGFKVENWSDFTEIVKTID
jgi:virulence-associated protein VapD